MTKNELRKAIRDLRAHVSKQESDEFFRLCREYLRKYHQLNRFKFEWSNQTRVINVFICKKPPCK
jgi:hypothetical protein